ncbi:hypothetical protein SAMN05421877_10285 [Sphingobacterium lactis]|uniref:Uncharacterized protein n=1 Tax=Sphingobacterium lactis TaxID=797291 RepID=A0A1H5TWS0_9SPHI|nr:hypothetical protein SAMN05421877_10285 [Sphingobacterium lactis]
MDKSIDAILRERTAELLQETIENGTLNFYYDPKRCSINELVRIWQGEETVIKIEDALKLN